MHQFVNPILPHFFEIFVKVPAARKSFKTLRIRRRVVVTLRDAVVLAATVVIDLNNRLSASKSSCPIAEKRNTSIYILIKREKRSKTSSHE